MLTLFSSDAGSHAASNHRRMSIEDWSRRDFLRVGSLGLGGLSLPWLLRQQAQAAGAQFVRDRAVVMLFLSGGASHIETFNPNMTVPGGASSATGEVQTTLPGVTFGGTFPQMARYAHRMAVVRSFQHPIGGHVQAIAHVLSGGSDPTGQGESGYGMNALYSRLRGANHPGTGMPTSALMNSDEVDPQYRNERKRVERASRPLSLGANFGPFMPSGSGESIQNLSLNMEPQRLGDRRLLLNRLDRLRRELDRSESLQATDRYTAQAFDVILGSAATAFDLDQEPESIRRRYDTSGYQVGKKVFRPSMLGQHFLTARRLIERGCGFITVHSAGWDMHADSNNPGIVRGMEMLGRPVDQAVSAFLEDLEQRGLSEKVLLIITGDFGRTPTINKRGGRDHWPRLCTLALAGGGIANGQVVGQSARRNDIPATEPVGPSHLLSTVMRTLFDLGSLRVARGIPSELLRSIETQPPLPGLTD